jgi:large subunit ribosomal protein L18
MTKNNKNFIKRSKRVRYSLVKKANGKPRLSVFRSNANIYAQVIDDVQGITIASASTVEKDLSKLKSKSNAEAAKAVGDLVAKRALKSNVLEVVFDRSGYLYHGKVKALADAAREAGLKF